MGSGSHPALPPFEILEHPADIGFRVRGRTLAELFENAALAMLSIAGELENVRPVHPFPLTATGADAESLLVNWLSEVLWWSDGKQIVFRQFNVHELDSAHVRAEGWGEPRDPERHRAKLIVKAVTYHQLKLVQAPGGWLAEVFLDI
jgi:SHS2 domain-containing protein